MIQVVVVIGLCVAVLLLILLSTYNTLMHLRQQVRVAWLGMDEALKQRYDLIPALVSAVQTSNAEAAGKLPAIITAKNQAAVAFNPDQLAAAEIAMTVGIRELLGAAEKDANLSTNSRFIDIRQKLDVSQKQIDSSCAIYNDRVEHLNESLKSFPTYFTGKIVGLKPQSPFLLPGERT